MELVQIYCTVLNNNLLCRVNATNALESTPLHTATCAANFNQEVGEQVFCCGKGACWNAHCF